MKLDFKIEAIQNPNIQPAVPRSFFVSRKLIFIAIIAVLIIVLVWFFLGRGGFNSSGVTFKIDGPSEVSSGTLVSYKVTYQNNNKTALSNVKLNVFYPGDSVVMKDGNVANITNETLDLGTLNAGASGETDLSAFIVGDLGNIKTLRATLFFQPSNISSTLQKDASLATTITSLAVPITLTVPPTIIGGQSVSYLVDYRNQAGQDLSNLRFEVTYPSGFKPSQYSPQPTAHQQNQDNWDVPTLKQGGGARITIQGLLSGAEKEEKDVSVILQKKITTPNGDVYVDFEKAQAASVISSAPISVSVTLNDSTNYVAHLNDLLHYKINFQNNNNNDITGLTLTVKLTGTMFDFSTVQSSGFFDSRTNTITWNASTLSSLNNLSANRSDTAEFQVRLKGSFSGTMGASDSFIKASAHLETPDVPSGLNLDKLTADDELVTRISTSPTFDQKVFLSDSVFGQTGPFPPAVNQKTAFTIRWTLVNPSSDVSSAMVTATLAPGVNWENKVRVNGTQVQPVFNSRLNTVTWDLGTLPGGVGLSFPQYETDFQISVTPSVNQVNQTVPLLSNVRFDGVDSFTKEKISRTIPDASTVNINDSKASGAVQPVSGPSGGY